MKYTLLVFFIQVVIGITVFHPSLYGDFIWDDIEQIQNNPYIHSHTNIPSLFTGGTFYDHVNQTLQGSHYRPLMSVTYNLIYNLLGTSPFFFHLVQLCLHIINTFLLYVLFTVLITKHIPKSVEHDNLNKTILGLISIIYLVHPMNSEVVSYIANIQEVLFILFGVSCTLLIVTYGLSVRTIPFIVLFHILSILSKETGILFFFINVVYITLFLRTSLKRYLLLTITLLSIYIVVRTGIYNLNYSPQNTSVTNTINDNTSFIDHIIQLPKLHYYYIKTFFYPETLIIGQHWKVNQINFKDVFLPLFINFIFYAMVFFTYATIYIRSKKQTSILKLFNFFLVWFCLTIFFHIHLFLFDFTVADRWFYLPMIGLLGCVSVAVLYLATTKKMLFMLISILLIIGVISSIKTYDRNHDWKDNITLYSSEVNKTKSYSLENNIGVEFYKRNQCATARTHFNNALNLKPDWPTAIINRGRTFACEKNYEKAIENYNTVILYTPHHSGYVYYIEALIELDRQKEAQLFLHNKAIKEYPNSKTLQQLQRTL